MKKENREMTPNDLKLSDCEATARPVPGSVAGAQDVTARSSSLQRMVERSRCAGVAGLGRVERHG